MSNLDPLGSGANPGFINSGTTSLDLHRKPDPLCASNPSNAEIQKYASHALGLLERSSNWIDSQKSIAFLLGPQAFTSGVVFGMAKNAALGAYELVKLINMLALAEFHERVNMPGFWGALRAYLSFTGRHPMAVATGVIFAGSWRDFLPKAEAAYHEREELFSLLEAVFSQPEEAFASVVKAQGEKYEVFMGLVHKKAITSNFQAGVMFGELLLDILLIVDGVTALAKIALATPRLARAVAHLHRLAPPRKARGNNRCCGG